MKVASVVKGVLAVAAIGTATYLYSNSSPRTKRKIKRTTSNAMHSVGDAMNDVAQMI